MQPCRAPKEARNWPRWARTTIPGSKVRCPAIGRGASYDVALELSVGEDSVEGAFCLATVSFAPNRREVLFVDDVVAVEHRPRLPTAELHDLAFCDTGTAEVSCRAPAQVVDETAWYTRTLGRSLPGTWRRS